MRSPVAASITGVSFIRGREAIRQYWRKAYADAGDPQLVVEAYSWDEARRRLTVWWRAKPRGVATRACEYMDFGTDRLIQRGEAYYGSAD